VTDLTFKPANLIDELTERHAGSASAIQLCQCRFVKLLDMDPYTRWRRWELDGFRSRVHRTIMPQRYARTPNILAWLGSECPRRGSAIRNVMDSPQGVEPAALVLSVDSLLRLCGRGEPGELVRGEPRR
jgi:hypothetical protein